MNKSTLTSRSVVQSLINAGVSNVVIAPGSRSAGLALACAAANRHRLLDLHIRIDEREAGFLALGIAKALREPVAVIVTSGTAVANLMPAVVEAHYSAIPLVVVTADRPEAVRFSAAPQTINQVPMFAPYANVVVDLPVSVTQPELASLAEVLDAALTDRQGPVHVNVQFDLPLVPNSDDLAWTPNELQVNTLSEGKHAASDDVVGVSPRGLFIVGDLGDTTRANDVGALANLLGWPIIWEPSGNAHHLNNALSHGSILCSDLPTPDVIVTIGTVGLSRTTLTLLKKTARHIAIHDISCGPSIPDPVLTATQVLEHLPNFECVPDPSWLQMWKDADKGAQEQIAAHLNDSGLTGPAAAVQLWNHLKPSDALLVGASWAVRHIELFAPARDGVVVYGNRGANGIDGLLSTAYGIALARRKKCGHTSRTYACLGDISFLYGMAGLLDSHESRPNLTIVVLDNDGGGIFSQLEQGAPEFAQDFETVFATPQGRDLWVVAEALGVSASRVTSATEFESALNRVDGIGGINVIVCSGSSRADDVQVIQQLTAAVHEAVTLN